MIATLVLAAVLAVSPMPEQTMFIAPGEDPWTDGIFEYLHACDSVIVEAVAAADPDPAKNRALLRDSLKALRAVEMPLGPGNAALARWLHGRMHQLESLIGEDSLSDRGPLDVAIDFDRAKGIREGDYLTLSVRLRNASKKPVLVTSVNATGGGMAEGPRLFGSEYGSLRYDPRRDEYQHNEISQTATMEPFHTGYLRPGATLSASLKILVGRKGETKLGIEIDYVALTPSDVASRVYVPAARKSMDVVYRPQGRAASTTTGNYVLVRGLQGKAKTTHVELPIFAGRRESPRDRAVNRVDRGEPTLSYWSEIWQGWLLQYGDSTVLVTASGEEPWRAANVEAVVVAELLGSSIPLRFEKELSSRLQGLDIGDLDRLDMGMAASIPRERVPDLFRRCEAEGFTIRPGRYFIDARALFISR